MPKDSPKTPYQTQLSTCLEGGGAVGEECRAGFCDPMRKGELEVRDHQLLDVGSAHILSLLNLHNANDLRNVIHK
jgi:hypothetical protein